jgi:uncharacterized repeat protein (TIGR03803 family)
MQGKKLSIALIVVLATFALASRAAAQTEKVLTSFNRNDALVGGLEPDAGLIFDAAGSLYGTTALGGTECAADDGCGTVFKLAPKAGGGWDETVLHNFNLNGKDGINPFAGVIFDDAGNLYGTTQAGGAYGYGTVFELERTEAGGFAEKVLHSFGKNASDGKSPYAGVTFDADGNLYGTTSAGGYFGNGAVFELERTSASGFAEKILHSFSNKGTGGSGPMAGLIFDTAGNLYGTTFYGGAYGGGTVFELTPTAGGSWTETVLHAFYFERPDGIEPDAGLIFDGAGNLYGTTLGGSDNAGYGTVFELSPTAGGSWTEQILYTFCSETDCADGTVPRGSLIFDVSGNLYGTTSSGGAASHDRGGTAFELKPTGDGSWTLTVLYSFGNDASPFAGLIFDTSGNLYGTTRQGGAFGGGTAFEITP